MNWLVNGRVLESWMKFKINLRYYRKHFHKLISYRRIAIISVSTWKYYFTCIFSPHFMTFRGSIDKTKIWMSKLISCQLIEKKKKEEGGKREGKLFHQVSTRGRDNWFRSVGKFSLRHLNFQLTKRSGAYSRRKFLIASPPPLRFQINSHHHRENSYSSRTTPFDSFQSILFVPIHPLSISLAPLYLFILAGDETFKNFVAFSTSSYPIVSRVGSPLT